MLEYGVEGKIQAHKTGPLITLFEFIPAPGIKNSKVVSLSDDIARAMSSISTRISSQPGKSTIGIEMPNDIKHGVLLSDLLKDKNFQDEKNILTLALGKDYCWRKYIYRSRKNAPSFNCWYNRFWKISWS